MKYNTNKKNLYYQTNKIAGLIDKFEYTLAKKIVLELLEKYPEDYVLKKQFSRILTAEKDYEQSKLILESLGEERVFKKLIALYIKLNEEEKLFDFYNKYYIDENKVDLKYLDSNYYLIQMYLKNKFDKSYSPNLEELSYFERQLIAYEEEKALDHIKQNHYLNNIEKSMFSKEIDISFLFKQVKEYIKENVDKSSLKGPTVDSYLFYYPDCGIKKQGGNSDYFEVRAFTNTNNILTMYPNDFLKNMDICNLKELQEEKTMIKVKSGLERFQSRYNK